MENQLWLMFIIKTDSHSLTLYAIARERALGIDVEYVREDLDTESIARHVFTSGEIEKLLKLPPSQRDQAFFAIVVWQGLRQQFRHLPVRERHGRWNHSCTTNSNNSRRRPTTSAIEAATAD
jgi:hypothetical protein